MRIDSLPESPASIAYTKRFDYDGSSNLIYEGFAQSRSDPSSASAVWAIKKYTYTGSNMTLTQWADGDVLEDNVWDSRAGLTYK